MLRSPDFLVKIYQNTSGFIEYTGKGQFNSACNSRDFDRMMTIPLDCFELLTF